MKILASLLALMRGARTPAPSAPGPPAAPPSGRPVDDELAELYNDVGVAAVEDVGDPTARILVYAEFQPDMSGHFLRYQLRGESVVRQAIGGSPEVEEAMFRLWRFTCEQTPAQCWRGIHYLVDDGAVTIRLLYDEQVDDRPLWQKDEEVVSEYFPGLPVVPVT